MILEYDTDDINNHRRKMTYVECTDDKVGYKEY